VGGAARAGREDAEFFTIGGRSFLAVASIRTGAGPYDFNATSTIFEWSGNRFVPFQEVPTFAAKQWKHWEIAGRHCPARPGLPAV
jgi:EPTP domain